MGRKKPHTMDWEQDGAVIIPSVNRVLGREIRAMQYLHWWTFFGSLYGNRRILVFTDS